MGDRRQHVRLSRRLLGDLSLGEWFQESELDPSSARLGPFHREADHTWERVTEVARLYGEVGYAEFLIHLGHDFGLVPEWDELVGPSHHVPRRSVASSHQQGHNP